MRVHNDLMKVTACRSGGDSISAISARGELARDHSRLPGAYPRRSRRRAIYRAYRRLAQREHRRHGARCSGMAFVSYQHFHHMVSIGLSVVHHVIGWRSCADNSLAFSGGMGLSGTGEAQAACWQMGEVKEIATSAVQQAAAWKALRRLRNMLSISRHGIIASNIKQGSRISAPRRLRK